MINPTGLGHYVCDGKIVQLKLTNDKLQRLTIELDNGLAIEIGSWSLYEREKGVSKPVTRETEEKKR